MRRDWSKERLYGGPAGGSMACACGLCDQEEPEVSVLGMRVIRSDGLPEGVLMFKNREGRVLGIIDNRKADEHKP